MSFFEELKRRKVFRVAATYAVVAWILMQIGEVTFPALNIPEWVMSTLVVVLLAGFPIAVIFAWIFDKTPQGYIKTDAPDTENIAGMNVKVDDRPFYLQKRNILLSFGVIAGILIGTYGSSILYINSKDDKSIAVLPFDNFSKDKDDEYLSDGITEDITMNLAKVKELTVISRTSVMKYKGSMKNAKEIAEELSVKYILEGSIRKIGERVRIVGQLIDAVNDKHIWSDSYDRNMADIFDIQADVSKEIANAMEAELTEKTIANIESVPTNNMDAYILYQRARTYYGMYTEESNETAIKLFNEALDKDKNYALAYSGLSDCYGQRYIRFDYGEEWIDSALTVADRALELNPNLAEAYKAKGLAYMALGNNAKTGELNKKALELNPGYHNAVANYGIYLLRAGEFFEAQKYLEKSIKLNPTSTSTENSWLSIIYSNFREYSISSTYVNNAIKYSPSVKMSYRIKLSENSKRKNFEISDGIISKYFDNNGEDTTLNNLKARLNYYKGNFNKAYQLFNENIDNQSKWRTNAGDFSDGLLFLQSKILIKEDYKSLINEGISHYESKFNNGSDLGFWMVELSALYCLNADYDKSLFWLEKSVQNGFRDELLLDSIIFENIKNHDRFKLARSEIKLYLEREKLKFKEAGLIPNV